MHIYYDGGENMTTLLLIDDDKQVLQINKKYFTGEGYLVHVTDNPVQGIELAKKTSPDCILLDVMMPDMNGYEVCEKIRSFSNAPIIFLTGKSDADDKITGLMKGADDYIVKPYSVRELKARIEVILRRINGTKSPSLANTLTFGNLTINKLEHKAYFHDTDLGLANREYEVLLYLATHPNKEITYEELGLALFETYMESDRRSVMVNVSRLRKKMTIDPKLENMIETVWSKGYKFVIR